MQRQERKVLPRLLMGLGLLGGVATSDGSCGASPDEGSRVHQAWMARDRHLRKHGVLRFELRGRQVSLLLHRGHGESRHQGMGRLHVYERRVRDGEVAAVQHASL